VILPPMRVETEMSKRRSTSSHFIQMNIISARIIEDFVPNFLLWVVHCMTAMTFHSDDSFFPRPSWFLPIAK